MPPAKTDNTVSVFVTTRPIFDRLGNVYGYELNFREGFEAEFSAAVAAAAGGEDAVDFWREMGFDGVLGLGRGHVTFPRGLLLEDVPVLFPPEALVVGVPGDVRGDRELIDACRRIRDLGYELELVDFRPDQLDSPFLEFGDLVRLHVADRPDGWAELCAELTSRGIRPLAAGVDTPARYAAASDAGFWYFEGDFFRRPVLTGSKELPTRKAHYLALLREVNKPELAYDELEGLIRLDVAMTYRLLRFINSAWHGLRTTVDSVRHALVLLGPKQVKLWASMLVLRELGEDKPRELFRRCLIRAKMAESLAPMVGLGRRASELFLMGMFSLIEALTNVPLARVLEGLPLNEEVRGALLNRSGPLGAVQEIVEHFELGQWTRLGEVAEELDLDPNVTPSLFSAAVRWADQALESM